MGRFSIEFEIANNRDLIKAQEGLLDPQKVRRLRMEGLVDPGATRLVLPEMVVKKLGLQSTGKIKVRYADGRKSLRDAVQDAYVEIMGRHDTFMATVEPKRRTALIGAFVLEDLDFLVDCANQRLVPRDPRYVVNEIE